ncbi:MAG: hypothetical protein IJ415_01125 [Clostridia bacterium]|nr:hypothetical protein [Clostridia bacterium]
MREKKVIEIDKFNNFNNSSSNIKAKSFYNFFPTQTLHNSKGITVATFPLNLTDKTESELNIVGAGLESVDGVAYFKQYVQRTGKTVHRLLVYGGDKKVYINQMMDDTYDLFWLYNLTFNSAPIVLSYKKDDKDAIILASEDSMKVWKTENSPYTISDVPIITSMCMHEGVLFCTIVDPAFKLWYATELDAENVGNISTTSGYVSLEDDLGYARKILVFNEDVYVFRDYGISKINYVKKDITASQVYLSNTKIYTNTVSVCGNSILFMTKDGLYSFNGIKVSKTNVELLNSFNFENDGAVASSLGEKYYLALRLNFEDEKQVLCEEEEYINNALLVVDTCDYSYEIIRGVDIKSLLAVKTDMFEKMLIVFNSAHKDKIGQIVDSSICFDVALPKFWESDSVVDNFSTKLFTKLMVKADAGVKFALKYDDKIMSFTTYNSGINEFIFRVCCKDLKLEISSENESAIVKNVILEYYEY